MISPLACIRRTPAACPGPDPGGTGERRSAWRWGLLVGAGWLIMAALRIWFSRAQTVPLANPGRVRLPDRGPGPGGRAGRGLLLLHPVPGRLSAADHPGLLVHAQPGDRLPRGPAGQRAGQRAAHAAGLRGRTAAGADPPGGLRGGHGDRAGAGRVHLRRVRDDRRDLPGGHAGLAAGRAQLADGADGAGPVRGRGRVGAAGRVLLRGALPGPGRHRGLRGPGRPGLLAPPGAAAHRGGGRAGHGPVGGRGLAAGPLPGPGRSTRRGPAA